MKTLVKSKTTGDRSRFNSMKHKISFVNKLLKELLDESKKLHESLRTTGGDKLPQMEITMSKISAALINVGMAIIPINDVSVVSTYDDEKNIKNESRKDNRVAENDKNRNRDRDRNRDGKNKNK